MTLVCLRWDVGQFLPTWRYISSHLYLYLRFAIAIQTCNKKPPQPVGECFLIQTESLMIQSVKLSEETYDFGLSKYAWLLINNKQNKYSICQKFVAESETFGGLVPVKLRSLYVLKRCSSFICICFDLGPAVWATKHKATITFPISVG